jgi:antitoxin ParD1/3/4
MKVSISLPDEFLAYLDQRISNRSQLIELLLQQWRKNQEDQAMAEACVILDRQKLGWDEECEQAPITDSQVYPHTILGASAVSCCGSICHLLT